MSGNDTSRQTGLEFLRDLAASLSAGHLAVIAIAGGVGTWLVVEGIATSLTGPAALIAGLAAAVLFPVLMLAILGNRWVQNWVRDGKVR